MEMKEIVFDYEEFKRKVDQTKPMHHCVWRKCVDEKHGVFYRLFFRLYGLSKEGGHIIVWQIERRTTISSGDEKADGEWYKAVVKKYCEPLGSTEGEWSE